MATTQRIVAPEVLLLASIKRLKELEQSDTVKRSIATLKKALHWEAGPIIYARAFVKFYRSSVEQLNRTKLADGDDYRARCEVIRTMEKLVRQHKLENPDITF